jgi:hypothetical protein
MSNTNHTTENEKEILTAGNRAVVINRQGSSVWANLYVNARNGLAGADITTLRWTGSTMAGARRWASKQLPD